MDSFKLVTAMYKDKQRFKFVCKCGHIELWRARIENHCVKCEFLKLICTPIYDGFMKLSAYTNKENTRMTDPWWTRLSIIIGDFNNSTFRCTACDTVIPCDKAYVACHIQNCLKIVQSNRLEMMASIRKIDEKLVNEIESRFDSYGATLYHISNKRKQLRSSIPRDSSIFDLGRFDYCTPNYYFTCHKCQKSVISSYTNIYNHLRICLKVTKLPMRFKSAYIVPELPYKVPIKLNRSNSCLIMPSYRIVKDKVSDSPQKSPRRKKTISDKKRLKQRKSRSASPKPIKIVTPVYFNGVFDQFGYFMDKNEFKCSKCSKEISSRLPRVYLMHLIYCIDDNLKMSLIQKFNLNYPNQIKDIVKRFDEKCITRSLSDMSFTTLHDLIDLCLHKDTINNENRAPSK